MSSEAITNGPLPAPCPVVLWGFLAPLRANNSGLFPFNINAMPSSDMQNKGLKIPVSGVRFPPRPPLVWRVKRKPCNGFGHCGAFRLWGCGIGGRGSGYARGTPAMISRRIETLPRRGSTSLAYLICFGDPRSSFLIRRSTFLMSSAGTRCSGIVPPISWIVWRTLRPTSKWV
jgi:hypothetical protein